MPTTLVRREGEALTVEIPAELARKLGLAEGDRLDVSALPDGFSATKQAGEDDFEQIMEAAHRFMDKHDEDFKRLAR